jgi:hypothetical protein
MRGPAALAGDLALLLRRHRRESTAFLAQSVHGILLFVAVTVRQCRNLDPAIDYRRTAIS